MTTSQDCLPSTFWTVRLESSHSHPSHRMTSSRCDGIHMGTTLHIIALFSGHACGVGIGLESALQVEWLVIDGQH